MMTNTMNLASFIRATPFRASSPMGEIIDSGIRKDDGPMQARTLYIIKDGNRWGLAWNRGVVVENFARTATAYGPREWVWNGDVAGAITWFRSIKAMCAVLAEVM